MASLCWRCIWMTANFPRDWEFVIGDRQSILKQRVSQTLYREKLLGALATHLAIDARSRATADGRREPSARCANRRRLSRCRRPEASRTRRVPIATVVAAAAIVIAAIAGIVVWQHQVREERARALVRDRHARGRAGFGCHGLDARVSGGRSVAGYGTERIARRGLVEGV